MTSILHTSMKTRLQRQKRAEWARRDRKRKREEDPEYLHREAERSKRRRRDNKIQVSLLHDEINELHGQLERAKRQIANLNHLFLTAIENPRNDSAELDDESEEESSDHVTFLDSQPLADELLSQPLHALPETYTNARSDDYLQQRMIGFTNAPSSSSTRGAALANDDPPNPPGSLTSCSCGVSSSGCVSIPRTWSLLLC